ncbi:DUF4345 domain-containing protein [Flavobacterium sp.]|uniref:DUF4345 domain-containing protein n=1 Tax=Flavobacterium sp. TaxID=239 RepID=UPI002605BEA3|nr:DUF4345 domain-containing protein [Flavobacterium sp.]
MIDKFENMFLIMTGLGLGLIGLGYGLNPDFYPNLFGYELDNINAFHVFKAFNGLYLAFSGFWIYSVFQPKMKKSALLMIIIVMIGLIIGRLWSIITDGKPHWLLLAYLGLEFFVLLQALLIYTKKYK